MRIEYNPNFLPPDLGMQEVVERKGLGHPDSLADGIAEATEIEYALYCREQFGVIPHHNLDKLALIGGLCIQQFGGGSFEKPIDLLFMGRASRVFAEETIPLETLQNNAAYEYLARVMPELQINNNQVIRTHSLTSSSSTRPHWFSPRSISDLPEYSPNGPKANDTATMISYWPLTESEGLTLDLEGYFYINNDDGLPIPRFQHIGQDIKVMTVRNNNNITATLAIPQVTTHTPDANTYFERERQIEFELQQYASEIISDKANVRVIVNTQTKGPNPRPYLVTGGSCTDFGEEGAVGRGNKTHGIISSFRPNTMEAPHGKNPTYFVGKILGYQADLIARKIYEDLGTRCQVVLQANIGDYLFEPSNVTIATEYLRSKKEISAIVDQSLSLGRKTTDKIIDDKYFLPRTNSWNNK